MEHAEGATRSAAERALLDSEERLRKIVAVLDEGIVVYDADGRISACNASAERILGLTGDDIIGGTPPGEEGVPEGTTVVDVTFDDGTPLTAENSPALRTLITAKPVRGVVIRIARPDGSTAWISANYQPLMREGEPRPYGVVASLTDITERHAGERTLRQERDRVQSYIDVAGTMMIAVDSEARIQLVNRRVSDVLGYLDSEMLGRDWFENFLVPSDRESGREWFARLAAGHADTFEIESRAVTKDGRQRLLAWEGTALRDDQGALTAVIASGDDVTDRRKGEEEIAYLAYHDRLTGLPNRVLLEEHLELALPRAARAERAVALLYLDLDDFKLVNDSLGHAAGDQVLMQAAERLREVTRRSDLLARQGGDEFLLLVTDIEGKAHEAAVRVANSVREALEAPFEIYNAEFNIGASIGVSLFPRDARDAGTLLRHADAAMYQAKRAGRNRVAFYAEEGRDALRRLSMATLLGRAVQRNEFELWYQPIVSLRDGKAEHIEALIRWSDPERGLVMPNDFVPVAEETGLIDSIGEWVIDALCEQCADWRQQGLVPSVSFNVSARELRRGELVSRLRRQLDGGVVEACDMVIEITESAAMQEAPERVGKVLRELADMGFRIAIDDFGSGWSSMARLRLLPVQMLKIDRLFLHDVPGDEGASAFLRALLEFGSSVGVKTVAEGVESEDQHRFLLDIGCEYAQGFHLGRPAPAAEVTRLLSPRAPA